MKTSDGTELLPIVNGGSSGMSLVHSVLGGEDTLGIGEPFSQKILLIESSTVAGTTHVHDIAEHSDGLHLGDELRFERESSNSYDHWAIKVFAPDGARIGYVSCEHNQILARLMDAGKRVFGKVSNKELLGNWNKITMEVYLDD